MMHLTILCPQQNERNTWSNVSETIRAAKNRIQTIRIETEKVTQVQAIEMETEKVIKIIQVKPAPLCRRLKGCHCAGPGSDN